MRRFLAMFVIGGMLAAGIATAPHAKAAEPQPRDNCSTFWNVKSRSMTVPVGTINAEWRLYVWVWWTDCTRGFEARQYRAKFVPANPGNCFRISEWRVNPNIIGDYNPGTRKIPCDGDSSRQATWNLWQTFVPHGSDKSKRCLGAKVTVGIIGARDQSFQAPSLCLPIS